MNIKDQQEMHATVKRLERLTRTDEGSWTNLRYPLIAHLVNELTTFCAVCDCTEARNQKAQQK